MDDLSPNTATPAGFARRPAPRAIGHAARGARIVAGELALCGRILPGNPFDVSGLPLDVLAALHGFGWLDDLAAVADPAARVMARRWVLDWVQDHPEPVEATVEWLPELAGRRLTRWLFHSGLFLPGLISSESEPFFALADRHLSWLSDSWAATPDGLPRIEALAGLAHGALHLRGHDDLAHLALVTLGEEAEAMGVDELSAPRSPEALLEGCYLLVWTAAAARDAGAEVPPQLDDAIARIARVLRGLRHADGALPQFHGSGPGVPGRLDQCLALSPLPAVTAPGKPLGFARMTRGRTTVVVDAAAPPGGAAAGAAHASTLALELVAGRQPLVVSCGAGAAFGPIWSEAARRGHSHSGLMLAGLSSSRFAPGGAGPDLLTEGPGRVWAGDFDAEGRMTAADCGPAHSAEPAHLMTGHDGWLHSHGLTYLRELWLEPDGRTLDGEETVVALDPPGQERYAEALGAASGLAVDIRFHLHPAVTPTRDGDALRLSLPQAEDWFFTHDGTATLRLEPSRWLDPFGTRPVASHQIVLTALLTGHALQLGWTFARAEVR